MNINQLNVDNIKEIIGRKCVYHGRIFVIIELLSDSMELVLEAEDGKAEIQSDAYGNARREARELVTIPIQTLDRQTWHPEFLELHLLKGERN